MTPENLHAEALRLQENEALAMLLAELDTAARDGLVDTPADQTDKMRDYQAMARVIKELRSRIDLLVATTKPKGRAPVA